MKKIIPLCIFLIYFSQFSAQTVTHHENFSGCLSKIAIDQDNDVLWMGTGLSSGGDLIMRDGDGNRTDISELAPEINFQSISALFMDESTLYAGGYRAVAIIDAEDEFYTLFTEDNSDLNYSNEIFSLTYDYNSELLYAGNIVTSTDVLSEDGWTQDHSLKRITASTFDYEEDCLWLANTYGDLIRIKDEVKTTFNNTNSDVPNMSYLDMSVDEEGNVYLLVNQNGFVHFDGTTATHHIPQNSIYTGIDMNCVEVDRNGKVWFGHNAGLSSFKDGVFTTYPLENYLGFYATVEDIVVDNNNHLWLATCNGLVEFSLDPLSSNDLEVSNIALYPNPSQGVFNFNTKESGTLSIFNISGDKVSTFSISKGQNQINTHLDHGIYMYSFTGDTTSGSGKIIIH